MTITVVIALAVAAIFLALSVISLVLWKKETRKRTESIKAIEKRLNQVVSELADSNRIKSEAADHSAGSNMKDMIHAIERLAAGNEDEERLKIGDFEYDVGDEEISFDFLETGALYDNIEDIEIDDIEIDGLDDFYESDVSIAEDYTIGRSGKKYTAEELETLIKE